MSLCLGGCVTVNVMSLCLGGHVTVNLMSLYLGGCVTVNLSQQAKRHHDEVMLTSSGDIQD